MKNSIVIIILTLTALFSKGQVADEVGKLIEISGWTIDKNTNDTLALVAIEVFNGSNRVDVIKSDLFGYFYLPVCSSNLKNDSLTIKVLYPNYLNEFFIFHVESVTNLTIEMTMDVTSKVDKAVYRDFYSANIMYRCADLRPPEWKPNLKPTKRAKKKYKHYCTGEIKTYNDLAIGEYDFNDWIEIK